MQTRFSDTVVRAFELVFRPWMYHRLANICLTDIAQPLPADHTVILAANHTSWWDAFLLREIHRKIAPDQPLVTLMEEEQLNQFPFFRWMGVVGLDHSLPAIRNVCSTLHGFRKQGPFWITMFPQGSIRASWQRPLEFQPGLSFFSRMVEPTIVLPVGIHLEMLNKPSPSAFVALGDPLYQRPDSAIDLGEVERRVEAALDGIYHHLATYGEEAPEYWPRSSRKLAREKFQPAGRMSAIPDPGT